MDVEQELEVTNKLVLAKVRRRFSPVEVSILSGSWQGQTYEEIASRRSRSNRTKNNAKEFVDGMNGMNTSISRVSCYAFKFSSRSKLARGFSLLNTQFE